MSNPRKRVAFAAKVLDEIEEADFSGQQHPVGILNIQLNQLNLEDSDAEVSVDYDQLSEASSDASGVSDPIIDEAENSEFEPDSDDVINPSAGFAHFIPDDFLLGAESKL